MNGDFKGDFTRDTFEKLNHFSRVLMQQGRVQLDADWNEQVDILLYYLRTLMVDLVGPRAVRGNDFMVTIAQSTQSAQMAQAASQPNPRRGTRARTSVSAGDSSPGFTINIGSGHFYIDGILVENDRNDFFYTFDAQQRQNNPTFLVYLDAWERQVTYIENNYIREAALGILGPDTATRSMVVWQVRVRNRTPDGNLIPNPVPTPKENPTQFTDKLDADWIPTWIPAIESPYRGKLKAKAGDVSKQDTTPCIIPPESRFRGNENQLYRVEIHSEGPTGPGGATFKWSRENGSVVLPISTLAGNIVTLDTLGRDKRFGLKQDDWVEIVDDDYYLLDRPNPLVQIDTVDFTNMQVILKNAPESSIGQNPAKHPFLRRWDQNGGENLDGDSVTVNENGIAIVESTDDTNWFTLEDNIQIQFQAADSGTQNAYHPGDYWLIPARVATGNVEWPLDSNGLPVAQDPHGIEHHYAPLALVSLASDKIGQICDLRRTLTKLWTGPAGCSAPAK